MQVWIKIGANAIHIQIYYINEKKRERFSDDPFVIDTLV